jgi:hypothetical protein
MIKINQTEQTKAKITEKYWKKLKSFFNIKVMDYKKLYFLGFLSKIYNKK